MSGTFRLAGIELRRFFRGRLTAAALVVLAVVPLLYGALYLYAFWDPYGRLDHVPAALVMQDRPARASDGTSVHAGQDLADELVDRRIFDWRVTDERTAQRELTDGDVHILLRIPADFSADLVTGPDQDATPQAARLSVTTDDATNYLSGVFSRTAFDEVRAAAAASAAEGYFDKMLIGFTDLKQQTRDAADGAGRLDDGAKDAESGASRLSNGLGDAGDGATRLSNGLGAAAGGAGDLSTGLAQLRTGAAQLATGTRRAAQGGRELATAVDAAADRIEPVLRDNAELIEDAADQVAKGAAALAANVDELDGAAADAVRTAEQLRSYLDGLPDDTPGIDRARDTADDLVVAAKSMQTTIRNADLDELATNLRGIATTARAVANAAPHLADDVARARTRVDALANGLDRLEAGAGRLSRGTADAAAGAADLRGGLYRLASGARQLDGGLTTLADGGRRLADGLGDLEGGAAKLARGLASGAEKIPGYDDADSRAGVLGDPVALDRATRHPAGTYGVGFAPYFLALALWVGAMITFMVLRPLNRRYLMSAAPRPRVALAGLLPAVAVGVAQATLLFAVVHLGLGLDPVHPLVTWGLLMLAATAFAAIIQLLGAALGPAGRIVALALLMLQLTSSGGTYPVQTTPGFFQAIHPLLPMTYVVDALRHAIDGGPAGTVMTGALALLGHGAGALILTILVAHRARRLTRAALHPELVI
ncbi:YhgE/Pip domain-containing protein [Actinoplanes sp. NPDC051633]|uniref:YhgE/Pip domain-containing protein n=1 Tax=Actinoplanes sp. NPDC051633 TaxID=3155670 RepID=UPI00342E5F21